MAGTIQGGEKSTELVFVSDEPGESAVEQVVGEGVVDSGGNLEALLDRG